MVLHLPSPVAHMLETVCRDLSEPAGEAGIDFSRPSGEDALIDPASVSWRVFKNPVTVFIGGVAAVILELAEPRVRTGVWEHSRFRTDPVGRLKRTGSAAMVTVYGPRSIAEPMIERVVRIHASISDVTPRGVAFNAADPVLLRWVHATASFGFVAAYREYARSVSRQEVDAFFEEGMSAARLYGVVHGPRSMSEMENLFALMKGNLERSAILFDFLRILREAPVLPRPLLWVQRMLIRAAVDIIPGWAREQLGFEAADGLRVFEKPLVKSMAALADRVVLPGSAPAQSCVRLGLPSTYLYT